MSTIEIPTQLIGHIAESKPITPPSPEWFGIWSMPSAYGRGGWLSDGNGAVYWYPAYEIAAGVTQNIIYGLGLQGTCRPAQFGPEGEPVFREVAMSDNKPATPASVPSPAPTVRVS